MSRRIDIELTSAQPDGRWTWRAAGARQPKGVLEGQVLYEGAKAGDVVRAEADFELDGIVIVSVLAPKEKKRSEPERIELLGPSGPAVGGVTTQLVGRSGGRSDRRDGDRRSDRRDGPRRDGDGGSRTGSPRPDGAGRGGSFRNSGPGGAPRGAGPRPSGPRDHAPGEGRPTGDARSGGRDGGTRDGGAPRPERRPTGDRPARGPGGRDGAPGRGNGPEGAGRGPRRDATEGRPSTPADRSRGRRLNPANVHRQAVLDTLPAEEQAVAEQLLRGGIPAVRTALSLEREKAVAEGRPVPNSEQLLALAESLLPRLKTAEWRDRAEAAEKSLGEISLRDLRSVVAGADAARDDESRALAGSLRDALDARVNTLRTNWTDEIEKHLTENRIVRALRLAGRPPETSARLPAELSERLGAVASAALTSDTAGERWVALLEAVAESPVRRSVKPIGLPADASPEILRTAHQQAGRVPALAALLGISIPPPPGPRRPAGVPGSPAPRPAPPAPSTEPVADGEAPPAGGAQDGSAPAADTVPAADTAPAAEAPPADTVLAAQAPAVEVETESPAPAASGGEAPSSGAPVADLPESGASSAEPEALPAEDVAPADAGGAAAATDSGEAEIATAP